jgi:integrase
MPTLRLHPSFVQAAPCPASKRRVDYFDTEQHGFLLEVRSSGGRTYYQRYHDEKGRLKQVKIGPAGVIALDDAREKGRQIVAAVFLGANPQQARVELRQVGTLAEFVCDRYMPHAKQSKRSWRIDDAHFRVNILPMLGTMRLDEITHEHVSKLMQRLTDQGLAPGTRNRGLRVLQHAFNLAKKWKVPGAGDDNPAKGIAAAYEPVRQCFLSKEEARRFIEAAAADDNRSAANAIMLLLLTGGRCNEILQAKWSYVDWEQRTLLVPLSKSGKPKTIALSSAAIHLLGNIKPVEDNPHIFSGRTGRPPEVFYPFHRICKRAGIPRVSGCPMRVPIINRLSALTQPPLS